MITVPESVLERFRAFSLYNSPYRAHDDGSAIDLYPASEGESASDPAAPSPVAGEVVAIERVRAPPKPYAPEHDFLLAIDTRRADGPPLYRTDDGEAAIARILHVDPTVDEGVDVGDQVTVGDALGEPIRAGFFAPWVGHHIHLGFRDRDASVRRAAGSLPVSPGTAVEAVPWDGRGTVVETADTYVVLDRPHHPDPGERFAAIAGKLGSDSGDSERTVPVDGGLPHYEHGGVLFDRTDDRERNGDERAISVLDERIGSVTHRTAAWDDPTVVVEREGRDPTPVEGLSLAASRTELGAKLICPELSLAVGEAVQVRIQ